jgi:hypothetical protein
MQEAIAEKTAARVDLTAAEAVWFATAALHKRHPGASGFTVEEIVDEALRQNLTSVKQSTLYQHALQHVVANRSSQPNRRRMLVEIEGDRRRLFVEGDPEHADRRGSLSIPNFSALPQDLKHWQSWYETWSSRFRKSWEETDPLMRLIGSGKHIWADEHADEYVRRLREGWE